MIAMVVATHWLNNECMAALGRGTCGRSPPVLAATGLLMGRPAGRGGGDWKWEWVLGMFPVTKYSELCGGRTIYVMCTCTDLPAVMADGRSKYLLRSWAVE